MLAVVTNIDEDHMATYGHDFERLCATFIEFIHRLPFYGTVVLCIDDPVLRDPAAQGVATHAHLRLCVGCRLFRQRAGGEWPPLAFSGASSGGTGTLGHQPGSAGPAQRAQCLGGHCRGHS